MFSLTIHLLMTSVLLRAPATLSHMLTIVREILTHWEQQPACTWRQLGHISGVR